MRQAIFPAVLAAAYMACSPAIGASITVDGKSNIFAAGQASPSAISSDGILPPSISLSSATTSISFSSISGLVALGTSGLNPSYGPDGDAYPTAFYIGSTSLPISDLLSNRNGPTLWGVFLGNTTPTGAHPASFDFSGSGLGIGFSSLNPLLRQSFFIGDGLTGTGSGTHQTFYVPTGATRLFLGVLDGTQINAAPGSAYFNNTGSFSVTYDLVVASVPEPETYAMLLAGLGLIGAAVKRRKAKQA